jgi:hypothetical protein|tara:strand:- start:85 stop:237 length:153 start_codon:yes stop_codon:yes gene_type:complete
MEIELAVMAIYGVDVSNVGTGYDSSKVVGGIAAIDARGGERESYAWWPSD